MNLAVLLNPNRYGYRPCQHCGGYGSSLKEKAPSCTKCQGTGLIKKQETQQYEHGHA